MTRRGFTMIEAVTTVIILGIAIPPALALLDRAAADRADAVNTARAVTLAGAVMETVLADVSSTADGLGSAALDDLSAYLDADSAGLRDRLDDVTAPYESVGMTWEVSVESLSGLSPDAISTIGGSGVADAIRVVRVTVEFPSAGGGRLRMPVSSFVRAAP